MHFTTSPDIPFCILNQFLWYNKYIQINNKTAYFKSFTENYINFVMDLLEKLGKLKSSSVFKMQHILNNTFYFQWLRLTYTTTKACKNIAQNNVNKNDSLTLKDHCIIRKTKKSIFWSDRKFYFYWIGNIWKIYEGFVNSHSNFQKATGSMSK